MWRRPRAALLWVAALLWQLSSPAWSQVNGEPPASAESLALQSQVSRWVATRQGVSLQQVQVQAPDPRLRIPACAGGYAMDAPFGTAQTVRARCPATNWQMYLRVKWEGSNESVETRADRPAEGAAANPPVNPAASAGPAAPVMKRAIVLTRAVARGTLLSAASADVTLVPAREVDSLVLTDPQHLTQTEAVRDLPPGVPLRASDVRPAVLVRQGQLVQLTVGQKSGFLISVRLEALQDGRLGDRISLRNPESGRTVSGVVTGPNQAEGA